MKNSLKFGFLALTIAVSVTACWDRTKPVEGDRTPVDSTTIDSPKVDSLKIDSLKNPVDSTKKAEKK